jgi:hypothetical protein
MNVKLPSMNEQGISGRMLAIGLVVLLMLGGIWYALSGRQQALRSSPSGLDGLQIWLASQEVSAWSFLGGWPIDQSDIGLLILPIYDTALDKDRIPPATPEEYLWQTDEYDLSAGVARRKAGKARTLVVLPKWRSGMRLNQVAHPVLLVPPEGPEAVLRALVHNGKPEVTHLPEPMTGFRYRSSGGQNLDAEIYAAQVFRSDACEPIIGTAEAMLLAQCPVQTGKGGKVTSVLVLSDPDLINNHGLRLGDNARIAYDIMAGEAGDLNVVIDYSNRVWLTDPGKGSQRERTWADLQRFFEPPFRILWICGAVTLVLLLWRGAVRYRAVRASKVMLGAGKMVAVNARARLMRLSGQDGALVGEYAAARLSSVASTVLGNAHGGRFAGPDAFLKYVERRHPRHGGRLRQILADIADLPAALPAADAIRHIDSLEQILEQIENDA